MAISNSMPALLLAATAALATATMAAVQTHPVPHPRATPSAEDRVADDLKEAETLLQKEQYQQAEEKLQAIVGRQSTNPQAWFDLGFAQSHLGKTTDSIAAYRKAAELSPKWFEAQQNLGFALAKSGDLAGAAAALKVAVTLKPTTGGQPALSRAWLSLAQVIADSQPQEALAAYQKASELDPNNADAQLGVARLSQRSGNIAAAEQQYLKLAETGNTESIERLVGLYIQQKRYADAETWLRKYIAANPGNTVAQIQLGKLLAAEDKTQDAIATLEPAYSASPNPDLARELSSLYLQAKQYDAASRLLQDLAARNPSDAQLHLDYGQALVHQHKYPEAEAELIKALQLNPRLVDGYFDLAYSAQQNKNYELVIRVLDTRAKLQPETPGTYFLRATAYDSLRLYKPAAENYKLFLAAAAGKFPDQEFQARHRLKAIQPN
ncbi:MAG TPA: tetratricopeptide repeat protein [Candidatus Angelobacter sp.]|nr:tetratricopeptide repeat protein [Candidatus Angelobacter sp.]